MKDITFLPHLNTQTNSNLSFSFITISELVDWSNSRNLDCLVIADYYPFEIPIFLHLCKEKKIKPIWGVKLFGEDEGLRYPFTVYPYNGKGYKEVLQKLFSADSPRDRVFSLRSVLSSCNNCLVVFEASSLEQINSFANHWAFTSLTNRVFIGFNFFLLNPTQNIASNVIARLLPFFSIKTLNKGDTKFLSLFGKTSLLNNFFVEDCHSNFLSYLNTDDLFACCTDDRVFYQFLLVQWQNFIVKINLKLSPEVEKPNANKKQESLLMIKSNCWQRLLSLPAGKEEKYRQTLEKELDLIEKLDYTEYFFTLSNVVEYLQEKKITIGPSRGSATASLVAYLLGITKIDPLKHQLFFERFLNEKRNTPPDVDLDIKEQQEAFGYLFTKYQKNHIVRIVVRKKIGLKLALTESAKICKIERDDLNKLTLMASKDNEIVLNFLRSRYPTFCTFVEKIKDLYYEAILHPSGTVITDKNLLGLVPLCLLRNSEYPVVLWEEQQLNRFNLRKYDFLSLRENLGFIQESSEIIKNDSLPSYDQINLQNKKTWDLFRNLLVTDIFQLDTISARNLLVRFMPTSFSELTIFLALNRPGTKRITDQVIKRKFFSSASSFSQSVHDILSETFDSIIFEEQISQLLSLVYDYSFAEAEVRRRELRHAPLEKSFLEQACKKFSLVESEEIYKQINMMSGYTFNKAHAVAYAYLTYYQAFLKANYYDKLVLYLLNKKEKVLAHLQEAFFFGFKIMGPDINISGIDWAKKEHSLIMGFRGLKNYHPVFFSNLIEERKKGMYQSWEDFLQRTIQWWDEKIGLDVLECWIKIGLFNSLQVSVLTLLSNVKNISQYLRIKKRFVQNEKGVIPFLRFLPSSSSLSKNDEKRNINNWEQEGLGIHLSYFFRWKEMSKRYSLVTLSEIFIRHHYDRSHSDQSFLAQFYAVVERIETKKNGYLLSLKDVRNSFKLDIDKTTCQNKNYDQLLLCNNELLFTLKIRFNEQQQLAILSCEEIVAVQS